MRYLVIRNNDKLQIIDEDLNTMFEMDVPEWYKGPRDDVECFCEFTKVKDYDWSKICVECLRNSVRKSW